MIRRTASEVLRNLESRIARLEGKTAYGRPDNYDARYTGEMEWEDEDAEDRAEEKAWKESLVRAKKAGDVVLRTLKQNNVPFSYNSQADQFEFSTRDAVVQALMALDVKPSAVSRIIKNEGDFSFAGAFFMVSFSRGVYIIHASL